MIQSATSYSERLVFKGTLHYVLLLSSVVIGIAGWSGALTAVTDDDISAGAQVLAFVGFGIVVGTLVAVWIARISIKVKISANELILQLPPLPKTRISLSTVTSVKRVEVNAFRDFGGLGVKGSKKNRLFGASGDSGVRVEYTKPGNESRAVTVLTHHPDEFITALGNS